MDANCDNIYGICSRKNSAGSLIGKVTVFTPLLRFGTTLTGVQLASFSAVLLSSVKPGTAGQLINTLVPAGWIESAGAAAGIPSDSPKRRSSPTCRRFPLTGGPKVTR